MESKTSKHFQDWPKWKEPDAQQLEAEVLSKIFDHKTNFALGITLPDLSSDILASDDLLKPILNEANRDLAALLSEVTAALDAGAGNVTSIKSSGDLLLRAIRCAIKQCILREKLGSIALTDELTGLYNRRGFLALAERQLKLARRSGYGLLLFFGDVDGMKGINDTWGHAEGDMALMRTGEILSQTFRDSDVVARFGGDEFAALAIEASDHGEAAITARLLENSKKLNAKEARYKLSFSFGMARFNPRSKTSIRQLLVQADRAMYEQKQHRSLLAQPISSRPLQAR